MSPKLLPLTKKQKELLDFVSQYTQRNGYSPTHEEMADALGVSSVATVHDHLLQLAKKKAVKMYKGAVRGIQVTNQGVLQSLEGIQLPLVGLIAAGQPIEAIEDQTATITVSPTLISGQRRSFVLQVRGDSMIEEGILDGDYVVVEQQDTANDGDIVVALLENELATLKRIFKEKTRFRLEPANANLKPIYTKNVTIQGKVAGVIHRFS